MSDLDGSEPPRGGGGATPLWVGAVVLAAAATAVLVLSDDARLLKLGLVAALWAALISAFAVAKLRSQAADGEERAAELQRVYERELEREVAARREFEAEAEAEARRRAAEDSAHEIQALRAELSNLRHTLEQVVGGDVLFERVALRAESTRVRSLAEQGGQLGSAARLHPAEDRDWESSPRQTDNVPASSPPGGQAPASPFASNPAVPNPAAAFPAAPNAAGPNPAAPNAPVPNPAAVSNPAPVPNAAVPDPTGAHPVASDSPASHPTAVPAAAANATGSPESDAVNGQVVNEQASEQRTEMFPRVSGEQLAADRPRPPAAPADGSDAPPRGDASTQWPEDVEAQAVAGSPGGKSRRAAPGGPIDPDAPPAAASRTRTDSTGALEQPPTGAATPGESDAPADRSAERQSPQVAAGAHAEGTSVTELLAAYGESKESQRRRRRRG